MKSKQRLLTIISGVALLLGAFPQVSRASLTGSDALFITDGINTTIGVTEAGETADPFHIYASTVPGSLALVGTPIWLAEPGVAPGATGYYSDVVGVTPGVSTTGFVLAFMSDDANPANYLTWLAAATAAFGAPTPLNTILEPPNAIDVLSYVNPADTFPNGGLQIKIATFQSDLEVPEPTTLVAGALLLLPFGASTLRILRKRQAA